MPLRTSTLLAALGAEGALDVAALLLKNPDGLSVGELVEGVNLSQSTVSRRLQDFEEAGLAEHAWRGQPFRLRERDRLTSLLIDASQLSEALLALDEEAERRFRDSLG